MTTETITEGTPKQIAWAIDIRARKLATIARKKRPILMGAVPCNGAIVNYVSPACAAEIVNNCPSAYSFILTRKMHFTHIIAQGLMYYTGKIY